MTGTYLEAAKKLAAAKAMQLTADRVGTLVFVTAACNRAQVETNWAVALNGGILCDSAYFRSDGGQGTALVFKAAIANGQATCSNKKVRATRQLWVTRGFKHKYPNVYDVLSRSVATGISKWRLVDAQAFAQAVAANEARPVRQRRNLAQIALVLDAELAALPLPTYGYTAETFLRKFTILDSYVLGACNL